MDLKYNSIVDYPLIITNSFSELFVNRFTLPCPLLTVLITNNSTYSIYFMNECHRTVSKPYTGTDINVLNNFSFYFLILIYKVI